MEHYVSLLIWSSVVLVLWCFFQFIWKRTILDMYRQRLFDLRDSLFMDCAKGHLQFDTPEYGMTRMLLNAAIRSAPQINLVNLLLLLLYRKRLTQTNQPIALSEKLRLRIAYLPEGEEKSYYEYCQSKVDSHTVAFFLFTSIPLLVLSVLISIVAVAKFGVSGIWTKLLQIGQAIVGLSVDYDSEVIESMRHDSLVAA